LLVAGIAVGAGLLAHPPTAAEQPRAKAAEKPPAARSDLLGDRLPSGALARLGTLRFRQRATIVGVAYAPDGQTVVTGGRDGSLRAWDDATGRERWRLPRDGGDRLPVGESEGRGFLPLAYSPDGQRLATPGPDNSVVLRDPATGREVLTLRGHDKALVALAFGPDGTVLLSMDMGRAVRAWDPATGKGSLKVAGRKSRVVAFAAVGETIATGGEEGVSLWDAASGDGAGHLPRIRTWVHSLAFAPDCATLAVGDREGHVYLWDRVGRRVRAVLDGKTHHHAHALCFSPDSKTLAVSSRGVVLWDVASEKEVGRSAAGDYAAAFSPDGKTLALASDAVLVFADARTGRDKPAPPGHTATPCALAFSPDGKTLASGDQDKAVRFWEPATGKDTTSQRGHGIHTGCLAFSPDGRLLLAGASPSGLWADPVVCLWEAASGKELLRFPGHKSAVARVLFLPDGKTFLTGSNDGDVAVWESATGKEVHRFLGVMNSVNDVALAPDGKSLAAAGYVSVPGPDTEIEGVIRLLDSQTGEERLTVHAGWDPVRGVGFTRDGRSLASAVYGEPPRLWEAATGLPRLRQVGGAAEVRGLAVSPDGRHLALGGADGSVRLFDLRTGQEVRRWDGHVGYVAALAFSPDGRLLASGSEDTTVLVWDLTALPAPAAPAAVPSAAELAGLWDDLADDGPEAYRAIGRLAAAPKEAVPLLRQKVRPAAAPDAKELARLLADLDADKFAAREGATAELRRLGDLAGPALRRYLVGAPPPEGRRRAARIVGELDRHVPPREQLRELRAVEALEWAGGGAAVEVLRALAAGAEESRLTREARAALARQRP
jgi:WD40 repeat protein